MNTNQSIDNQKPLTLNEIAPYLNATGLTIKAPAQVALKLAQIKQLKAGDKVVLLSQFIGRPDKKGDVLTVVKNNIPASYISFNTNKNGAFGVSYNIVGGKIAKSFATVAPAPPAKSVLVIDAKTFYVLAAGKPIKNMGYKATVVIDIRMKNVINGKTYYRITKLKGNGAWESRINSNPKLPSYWVLAGDYTLSADQSKEIGRAHV